MNTLAILEKLIAFATVSRDPNRPLIDFVQSFLSEHGIESEVVEADGGRKANLFATVGPRDKPGVLLSGHTDVVPVDNQSWSSDPFKLWVANGRAFGRGTADMKGFVASALALAGRAASRKLTTPLHLALSHDEEIGCVGVRSLIDTLRPRLRPNLAIIGEPTNMTIATGHKGKLAARAICHGVTGHSALAPKALNAIHLACDFVAALRRLQEEIRHSGMRDLDYDVPYSTLHAGRIEGGTALNIVPDRCTLEFEIRSLPEDDAEATLSRLMEEAASIAEARHGIFPVARIEIERLNEYPGLGTPADSAAVAFMSELVEQPALRKVAFGTEGGLFSSELGIPTIICGPGSMEQGHKADEFISLDQLDACDRLMDRLLEKLSA